MRLCHCGRSSSLSLITAVCASILRPSLMLLWGCSSAFELELQLHDFISGVVSRFIMVALSHQLKEAVGFPAGVWHVLSSYIQQAPRDVWGSLMALLTSDPGDLNEFLPALFSHRDTLKIVFDTMCVAFFAKKCTIVWQDHHLFSRVISIQIFLWAINQCSITSLSMNAFCVQNFTQAELRRWGHKVKCHYQN